MYSDIASQIRTMVSKKKKRYQKQGFDLDLTYVTERIIAMGFPADKLEALYRNSIDDVARFFELNHSGKYKIYNLCRERSFDASKFSGEIGRFPFDDHNPPAFSVLKSCIEDIGEFLARDNKNIVAINCKAGKGRTGVIVCCSMLYSRVSKDATTALTEYGRCRTYNGKGVTIPSQIRYIFYYDHFLKNNLTYTSTPLWLRLIKFEVMPNVNNAELQFSIYEFDSLRRLHLSKSYKISKHNRVIIFHEMLQFPLYDDLRFEFMQKSLIGGNTALCHCWLNTYFVVNQPAIQRLESDTRATEVKSSLRSLENPQSRVKNTSVTRSMETMYKVTLTKPEIDKANKDISCRVFPANFRIEFLFSNSSPDNKSSQKIESIHSFTDKDNRLDFFPMQVNESMIPQLEEMWKSTSTTFYS